MHRSASPRPGYRASSRSGSLANSTPLSPRLGLRTEKQRSRDSSPALNFLARRGSEAARNSDDEAAELDSSDPFVVVDADEAMANAERDLKADAEWKRIQQNTFTRWANEHLKQAEKNITNLETDLSDGLKLIALIEVLSGKRMPKHNKKPTFRSQKLENVSIALQFLEREGVTLVNIDSTDIVDCKLKLILGLIWTLILHYAISMPMWDGPPLGGAAEEKTPKQRLLGWVKDKLPDLPVHNFTTDWNNGRAVGALVDSVAPGLCPDWEDWDPKRPLENAREAMDLADQWLNVPKLLTPEEITNPNVDEQSMMTYLSQFPNAKLKPGAPLRQKTNPSKVRAYGPGLEPKGLVAKAPAKFTVETFGAGDGEVAVEVTGPRGKSLPCEVVFNNDRKQTYSCSYFPEEEGDYVVKIKFANREIPKSPYNVNVEGFAGDASKVTAAGPGLEPEGVVINRPTYFDIFTENAGKGNPEVIILDSKGKKDSAPIKITAHADKKDVYRCEYVATVLGLHSVNVFYAGNPIPDSPFGVMVAPVSQPSRVWASGRGLQPNGIRVNETVEFKVHTEGAGEGAVGVKIIGPGGKDVHATARKVDDFTTEYTYTPQKEGRHTILITFANQEIPRSPFNVNIGSHKTSKIKAYGPGLKGGIVNRPAVFTVDTCGETGSLGFSIEGPSQAKISCKDNGDGSADVEYLPTAIGEYAVHILCDKEDIPGSPYMAQIMPATDFYPDRVKVFGPGVENGINPKETTYFTVDITDAGEAPLEIMIIDELGQFEPDIKEKSEGIFECSYMSRKGMHKQTIMVNFGGVAVPGSPFHVTNNNPNDASKVLVYGPGVEKGVRAGVPVEFTVDCTKSGPGDVKVKIESSKRSSVPVSMINNGDDTFTVTYEAKEAGPQTITITLDDEEVPQSPIRLDVKRGVDLSAIKVVDLEPRAFVDCVNDFYVDLSGLPPADQRAAIDCDIRGPTGSPVDTFVTKNPDGTHQVSYTPTEEGEHEIDVRYDGTSLPDTPFPVNAERGCDPSKVKVSGDGLEKGIVDEVNTFVVETKNAGTGELGIAVEGPSEAEIMCHDNKDGTCTVDYVPTEEGDYDVNIKFGDEHIPGSPFKVPVTTKDGKPKADASKVVAYGAGLEPGQVLPGKPAAFFVDSSATGEAPVDVSVTSSGKTLPRKPIVVKKGDGIHEVTYVPPPVGEPYDISVKYGGKDIPGSPFGMTSNPNLDDVVGYEKNGTGLQRKKMSSTGDDNEDGRGGLGSRKSSSDDNNNRGGRGSRGGLGGRGGSRDSDEGHGGDSDDGDAAHGGPGRFGKSGKKSGLGGKGGDGFGDNDDDDAGLGGRGKKSSLLGQRAGSRDSEGPDGDRKGSKTSSSLFGDGRRGGAGADDGDDRPYGSKKSSALGDGRRGGAGGDDDDDDRPHGSKKSSLFGDKGRHDSADDDASGRFGSKKPSSAFGDGRRGGVDDDDRHAGPGSKKSSLFGGDGRRGGPGGDGDDADSDRFGNKKPSSIFGRGDADDAGRQRGLSGSGPGRRGSRDADEGRRYGSNEDDDDHPSNRGDKYGANKPFNRSGSKLGRGGSGDGGDDDDDGQGGAGGRFGKDGHRKGSSNLDDGNDRLGRGGRGGQDGPHGKGRFGDDDDDGHGRRPGDSKDGRGSRKGSGGSHGHGSSSDDDGTGRKGSKDHRGNAYPHDGEAGRRRGPSSSSFGRGGDDDDDADADGRGGNGSNKFGNRKDGKFGGRRGSGGLGSGSSSDDDHDGDTKNKGRGKNSSGSYPGSNNNKNRRGAGDNEDDADNLGGGKKGGFPFKRGDSGSLLGRPATATLAEDVDDEEKYGRANDRRGPLFRRGGSGDNGGSGLYGDDNDIDGSPYGRGRDGPLSGGRGPSYGRLGGADDDVHGKGRKGSDGDAAGRRLGGQGGRRGSEDGPFKPIELNGIPLPPGAGGRIGDRVEATVKTPSGRVETPKVLDNGNGSLGVAYQPHEAGPHNLDVKYSGDHVQGSPFKFHATPLDGGKVAAYGPGLTHGVCGDPAKFVISTKGAGAGGLSLAVEGPSKAEIHCQDNKDGTVDVSYLPTAPGEYKISAKFADQHIDGSPFTCKITGEGTKRNAISVGSASELSLPENLSDYDLRSLNAYIVSPSGVEEPCFLKKLPKGNNGISFTPREVGEHLVSVKRNGKHIKNSPFQIMVNPDDVGDASRVKVRGPALNEGRTHKDNVFTVDTKNAGYGGLSLSVEGPSKAEIKCKDNEDGTLDVSYKPTEPGLYIINLKFADQHVPGSPFAVAVSGEGTERLTEKIKRVREAVPITEVGSQCRLTFKMPGVSCTDLKANVTSPTGKIEKAVVTEIEDGLYSVNFVPYELGIHTVSVMYRDVDIPGSPFQFTVGPLQDGGAHRVHAGGPGLERGVQGQPADFNVWTREAGHGSLAISVEGPSKAEVDFKDRKDGSCHVSYIVEEPGEYSVGIRFNDTHIPGSPYKVYIQPSADEAERVRLSNVADSPIAPDVPQTMLLNMNGADGDVECKIIAPSGREDDCFITPLGDGEHSVRFVPKEEGTHYLHAKLNGVHIPGSPFKIIVGPTKPSNDDPSTVGVSGPGIERGITGQQSNFVIDTSGVGAGTLSITVDGPSKVDLSCNEVEEGYEVRYTPMVPGKYFVTVKYNGKNVKGSPFSVNVGGDNLLGTSSSTTLRNIHSKEESRSSSMTMETMQRTSYIRHQYSEQRASSMSVSRSSTRPIVPGLGHDSDSARVSVHGSGLESASLHRRNTFSVDAARGGQNCLFVGVFGPEVPVDEIVIKHRGGQRYSVDYVVKEKGDYIVFVKWGEEHVPGSPFHITAA